MYDYVWSCMTMNDYVWLCLTMIDYVYLCMTMYDYIWHFMALYDYVWQWQLIPFNHVWPRLTVFDCVLTFLFLLKCLNLFFSHSYEKLLCLLVEYV